MPKQTQQLEPNDTATSPRKGPFNALSRAMAPSSTNRPEVFLHFELLGFMFALQMQLQASIPHLAGMQVIVFLVSVWLYVR